MAAKKPSVESFLRLGILPDDVPPLLSSKELVAPSLGKKGEYQVGPKTIGRPSPFNGSKRGFGRRAFGIPHPVFVRDAALFFNKNWELIEKQFESTEGSASVPVFEETRSRALHFTPHSRLPAIRLKTLAQYRYCLVTDVSRCFPSIYTHSIPWALHGKDASKADRKWDSPNIVGNRLDFIVRQSQDGQTMGLPVGSDHSRVIAEIVLKSVDKLFQDIHGSAGYIRHVDDFWIGGQSSGECENSLQVLRSALSEFSLDVNELKTRILPTSSVIAENWPYDLEWQLEDALDLDPDRYEGRIVSLLGSVVEYSSKSQDDGVVKFFLRRIDHWEAWDKCWSLLEPFLAHCGVQFPHSFSYVSQVVAWRIRTGRDFDKKLWSSVATRLLRSSTTSGRDAEALWALWLIKELGAKISVTDFEQIAALSAPVVAATALHFDANGFVKGKVDAKSLWARVEDFPLSGAEWPLTLELMKLKIAAPKGFDLKSSAPISSIFEAGASMVNWNSHPPAFITADDGIDPDPSFALSSAISGYEDDGDDSEIEVPF